MIRNRLGLPARFLMVATAVACWIPCVPAAAVAMPLVQTPPPAPTNLVATLEGTSVRLTWTASTPLPGESPVTGYRIQMFHRPDLTNWTDVVANTGSTAPTYLHTTPPRGTSVHYQVAAINAAGRQSEYLRSSTPVVTPPGTGTTGAAPSNLRAVAAGPTSITLSWNRPTVTGGNTITGYQVEESANGSPPWTLLTPTPTNVYRVPACGSPGRRHPLLPGQGGVRQPRLLRALGVRASHHGDNPDTGCTPEPERNGRWPDGHQPRLGRAGLERRERNYRLPDPRVGK